MNKKIIILFLVMCIAGFTMSPVNAFNTNHEIIANIGDVIEFKESPYSVTPSCRDKSFAYRQSGLFDVSAEMIEGADGWEFQYTCVATTAGEISVEIPQPMHAHDNGIQFYNIYNFFVYGPLSNPL
jgi:hypothetical protein